MAGHPNNSGYTPQATRTGHYRGPDLVITLAIVSLLVGVIGGPMLRKARKDQLTRQEAQTPAVVDMESVNANGFPLGDFSNADEYGHVQWVFLTQNIITGLYEVVVVKGEFEKEGDPDSFKPLAVLGTHDVDYLRENFAEHRDEIFEYFDKPKSGYFPKNEAPTIQQYWHEVDSPEPISLDLISIYRRRAALERC